MRYGKRLRAFAEGDRLLTLSDPRESLGLGLILPQVTEVTQTVGSQLTESSTADHHRRMQNRELVPSGC